ncbi:hypothetical protein ACHAXN_009802 [Cyclotella atomus]
MASLIAAVKRKLAFLSSFVIPAANAQDVITNDDILETARPTKRRRLNAPSDSAEESPLLIVESDNTTLQSPLIALKSEEHLNKSHQPSSTLLQMLPPHVLSRCLLYLGDRSNRFALQTTCTLFNQLSNQDDMLADVELGGDWSDSILHSHVDEDIIRPQQQQPPNNALAALLDAMGFNRQDDDAHIDYEDLHLQHRYVLTKSEEQPAVKRGILTENDTSVSACKKLVKFSVAGNLQATYMLSMILCYCFENVSEGLALLRLAASHGDLRSIYNLALILRDTRPTEATNCLILAARYGYIPAWQEKLTPTEMRVRFGDLDAATLCKYLDPPCLNRLLGRHYLECNRVKRHHTSHCWNPLCGRWAYKATSARESRRRHDNATANDNSNERYSIRQLLPELPNESVHQDHSISPLGKMKRTLQYQCYGVESSMKVSRMKMCSSCRRAKYCSKLCQVYDWRSGRHKAECPFLNF